MITKQEQEILDNAPEWAECIVSCVVPHGNGVMYAKIGSSGDYYVGCDGSVFATGWNVMHNLADLRKKQEPIKPRMKVEYVIINGNDKQLCGVFSTEAVYYMSSNKQDTRGEQYTEVTTLDAMACASHLYRKVETEIKTEKRWVSYDPKTNECFACEKTQAPAIGFQIIEITVDV